MKRLLPRLPQKPEQIGTPTSDGGLYLNPDEKRWLSELMGRLELVHVRVPADTGIGRGVSLAYLEAAKHDVTMRLGTHIAHEIALVEVGLEGGHPALDHDVVRAYAVMVRHGLPPMTRKSWRSKQEDERWASEALDNLMPSRPGY